MKQFWVTETAAFLPGFPASSALLWGVGRKKLLSGRNIQVWIQAQLLAGVIVGWSLSFSFCNIAHPEKVVLRIIYLKRPGMVRCVACWFV